MYLFFATAEHWDDTKADGMDRKGGWPIFRQDRETNVAVAVDVRVDGNFCTNKYHLHKITIDYFQHKEKYKFNIISTIPLVNQKDTLDQTEIEVGNSPHHKSFLLLLSSWQPTWNIIIKVKSYTNTFCTLQRREVINLNQRMNLHFQIFSYWIRIYHNTWRWVFDQRKQFLLEPPL